MNAFAAGSSADISQKNIEVNPAHMTKNQSKQFQLHDGPSGPFGAASYAPVSAMSGIMGVASTSNPMGVGSQNNLSATNNDEMYGLSNQQSSSSSTMP